jgi:hypothetical protein
MRLISIMMSRFLMIVVMESLHSFAMSFELFFPLFIAFRYLGPGNPMVLALG